MELKLPRTEEEKTQELVDHICTALRTGHTGPILGSGVETYYTSGGTFMVATQKHWTDSRRRRDLLTILPGSIGVDTRVLQLYVAVNPDLVWALRRVLDGE